MGQAKLVSIREEEARSRLSRAQSRHATFWDNLKTQATLHEDLLGTVERLEESARAIWGQRRAPELLLSPQEVADQVARLQRSLQQRQKELNIQATLQGEIVETIERLEKHALTIWDQRRAPELSFSPQEIIDRVASIQRSWLFRRVKAKRFLRGIRCYNSRVELYVVRAWAGDEQRRQQQTQDLKRIEKQLGRSDGTAKDSNEDWVSASRAAVKAVVSLGVRRLDAANLVGLGNRAEAFQRGIRDLMKYARGWACTAMSMRSNFPLTPGLFDLVIIDEASQCSVAQALPLAYRAKRIAVVGDPNQLTPITGLLPKVHTRIAEYAGLDAEDLENAGVHHTKGSAYLAFEYQAQRQDPQQPFLLNEHYRSQPEIVRWFNREFYNDKLTILTELRDESDARVPESTRNRPVMWTDVEGKAERGSNRSWVNREEATLVMRQMAVFLSYPSLAGGLVFSQVRGYTRGGCFHYIGGLDPFRVG